MIGNKRAFHEVMRDEMMEDRSPETRTSGSLTRAAIVLVNWNVRRLSPVGALVRPREGTTDDRDIAESPLPT